VGREWPAAAWLTPGGEIVSVACPPRRDRHRRRIGLSVRYLLLDGLWVSVRGSDGRASKRVVLAAYGISADGSRELLDYRQALSESAWAWGTLLRSLVGKPCRAWAIGGSAHNLADLDRAKGRSGDRRLTMAELSTLAASLLAEPARKLARRSSEDPDPGRDPAARPPDHRRDPRSLRPRRTDRGARRLAGRDGRSRF
jgi:hypothetical protein